MSASTLTTLVPTLNCAASLRTTLPALQFADEILVVDTFSTDGTPEVTRSFPKVRLMQRRGILNEYINAGIQAAKGAWIYVVDADEVPTPERGEEIRRVIAAAPPEVGGFSVPSHVYWCGGAAEVRSGGHRVSGHCIVSNAIGHGISRSRRRSSIAGLRTSPSSMSS